MKRHLLTIVSAVFAAAALCAAPPTLKGAERLGSASVKTLSLPERPSSASSATVMNTASPASQLAKLEQAPAA